MNRPNDDQRRGGESGPRGDDAGRCRVDDAGSITCPACGGVGVEKKQKWFCARCGRLLQTCCD